MSYEICSEDSIECNVANLIFYEGLDNWLGYFTDSRIRSIISIASTYFHEIAETLVGEIKKRLTVTSYFDPATVKEPEREWLLLNHISTKERLVSYEEFCKEHQDHFGWLESLFRVALVSSLCVIDLAIKHDELISNQDSDPDIFEDAPF